MDCQPSETSYRTTVITLLVLGLLLAVLVAGFYIWRSVKPMYPTPFPVVLTTPLTPVNPPLTPIDPFNPPNVPVPPGTPGSAGSYAGNIGMYERA